MVGGTISLANICPAMQLMPRVLVNIQSNDGWSVHFIGPDNISRIGPWLLLDSHDEARAILRWGNISADETTEHE